MASRKQKPEAAAGGPKVESVPIDARSLHTVAADHPAWEHGLNSSFLLGCKGAIVRLRPPDAAPDADVDRMREDLRLAGAERVVVERRRGKVVPGASHDGPSTARPARSSVREVVLKLVAEANTPDRQALLDECEAAMAAEGL